MQLPTISRAFLAGFTAFCGPIRRPSAADTYFAESDEHKVEAGEYLEVDRVPSSAHSPCTSPNNEEATTNLDPRLGVPRN